jgi:hypothetical protein
MKKILIAAIAVSLAAATQVGALTVTVSSLGPNYNVGQGGGEFNVTPITGTGYAPSVLVGGGFETFCVDRNIGITIPGTYNATVDATGAITGGQQVSLGTAYLYSQFATGVLAGYNYTPGVNRANSAYMLQLAIWTLQLQYGYGSTLGTTLADLTADLLNPFVTAAANAFGGGTSGLLAAMAGSNGTFGVGALNLTFATGPNTGAPAQSMLTLLPDGGTTLMLMGIGFSSLALVSRKLRA